MQASNLNVSERAHSSASKMLFLVYTPTHPELLAFIRSSSIVEKLGGALSSVSSSSLSTRASLGFSVRSAWRHCAQPAGFLFCGCRDELMPLAQAHSPLGPQAAC